MRKEKDWIQLFEWFHQNPELGFFEKKTTQKIKEILKEEEIELLDTKLETGVIAVVRGGLPGITKCYRADIDALPVEENTELSYKSQNKGIMHACGHDFHTVTALKVASELHQNREKLRGTIYVVFQPAEEVAGGARKVLEAYEFGDVQEFYGIHVEPSLKEGEISIEPGGVMAAADGFTIRIAGRGTHAATPHLGENPIPYLAELTIKLPSYALKGIPKSHPAVVSVTKFLAGTAWNIIPGEGELQGTIRTLNVEDRATIYENVKDLVEVYNRYKDISCDLDWHHGPNAVINDENLVEKARKVAFRNHLTERKLEPSMMSEDFGQYQEENKNSKTIGIFMKVGSGIGHPLHHCSFKVNPQILNQTAHFIVDLLMEE